MKEIKVDEQVWKKLQELAEPFVDKEPNDVLHRILKINNKQPKIIPNNNNRISQENLIPYIIQVLYDNGGRATKETVEKKIYQMFKNIFNQEYYQETVSHSVPRWRHNIAWAKEMAKQKDLIKNPKDSGRGIWELTSKGERYCQKRDIEHTKVFIPLKNSKCTLEDKKMINNSAKLQRAEECLRVFDHSNVYSKKYDGIKEAMDIFKYELSNKDICAETEEWIKNKKRAYAMAYLKLLPNVPLENGLEFLILSFIHIKDEINEITSSDNGLNKNYKTFVNAFNDDLRSLLQRIESKTPSKVY